MTTYLELTTLQVSDASIGDNHMNIRVEIEYYIEVRLGLAAKTMSYPSVNKYTRVGNNTQLAINYRVPYTGDVVVKVYKDKVIHEELLATYTISSGAYPPDQSEVANQATFASAHDRCQFTLSFGATAEDPVYATLGELFCVEASNDISAGTVEQISNSIGSAYDAFGQALAGAPDPRMQVVGAAAQAVGSVYSEVLKAIGKLDDGTDNVYMTIGTASDKYNQIWPNPPVYTPMKASDSVVLTGANPTGSNYLAVPLLKYALYKVNLNLWDSDVGSDTSLGTVTLDGSNFVEGESINPSQPGFESPTGTNVDNPGFFVIHGQDGDKGGVYVLTYKYSSGSPGV
ncbi:hypothetical protein [Microbulbifer elongatus]|uniref:hypothetical protein n=1 Tax=Microbulbifer elongatus TaxID=86173 RepID=UPI001E3E27DC|nr:hypothetical protein [Microbulbifer elongatus]